jgi:hypothetical protein
MSGVDDLGFLLWWNKGQLLFHDCMETVRAGEQNSKGSRHTRVELWVIYHTIDPWKGYCKKQVN